LQGTRALQWQQQARAFKIFDLVALTAKETSACMQAVNSFDCFPTAFQTASYPEGKHACCKGHQIDTAAQKAHEQGRHASMPTLHA